VGTTNQGFKEFIVKAVITGYLTYNDDKTEVYVRDFVKYSSNEYWIATESGVFIYDVQKGSFINLKNTLTTLLYIRQCRLYPL